MTFGVFWLLSLIKSWFSWVVTSTSGNCSSGVCHLSLYRLFIFRKCIFYNQAQINSNQILHVNTVLSDLSRDHLIFFRSTDVQWYTPPKNVWGGPFLAGNNSNHQNFDPSLLPYKCWLIFVGMKQIFLFFFEKQKTKWPTQKTWDFQICRFSIFFFENFMD